MNEYPLVQLGNLMAQSRQTVDPRKTPDEVFDLFSIPAFDVGAPEVVPGSQIGSSKQVVEGGDVLLSRIVPHIRRAWVVKGSTRRCVGSSEWIVFRSTNIEPAYLRHVLLSDRFHEEFMRTVAGVGGSLLRARPAQVAAIEIPLPPIEEQRRIAAILDAADALRAKRRQAIAKLDALTQAIFIDMFGAARYPNVPLGELAAVQSGLQVTARRTHNPLVVPYLRVANVKRGFLDLSEVESLRITSRELERTLLEAGDLLVVEGHGNKEEIGRVGQWDGEIDQAVHQNHLIRVRCNRDQLLPQFAEAYMNSPNGRRCLLGAANTTSGLNTISTSDVRDVSVPVPPISEQDRFVAASAAAKRNLGGASQHSNRLDTLFASLQQRAFRGEL